MIELAFVVCLRVVNPALCEEKSIGFLPDVSLMGCMISAQPQLAQWAEVHPGQQIAHWRCRRSARGVPELEVTSPVAAGQTA